MATLSTGMGDYFSALLMSLMALRLALVDRNPFQPCLQTEGNVNQGINFFMCNSAICLCF